MSKLRYVVFTDNRTAEDMAMGSKDVYTGAFVGRCQLDGLYPLSPEDIRTIVSTELEFEHSAIVECFLPYHQLGMYREIYDKDIISVNKIVMLGHYAPLRRVIGSCVFNGMTDINKDELGWKHPMAGISYARNRQCMTAQAYNEMILKIAGFKGNVYVEYLNEYFRDKVLPESFIKDYKL